MAGKLLLAVGERPQLPTTWTSPQGCLRILLTWLLASLKGRYPREEVGSHSVFHDLASEFTCYNCCSMLVCYRVSAYLIWEEISQV